MLGTVLWQTFLEAFQSPEIAIKASKPLLSQVKFPHEAIILAQLGQVIFNFFNQACFSRRAIFSAPSSGELEVYIFSAHADFPGGPWTGVRADSCAYYQLGQRYFKRYAGHHLRVVFPHACGVPHA